MRVQITEYRVQLPFGLYSQMRDAPQGSCTLYSVSCTLSLILKRHETKIQYHTQHVCAPAN